MRSSSPNAFAFPTWFPLPTLMPLGSSASPSVRFPRHPDEPRVRSDEELDAVGDQPNPQNAVSITIGLPPPPSIPERRRYRESLSKLARVPNESNEFGWTFLSAFPSPTSPRTSCNPWIPLVKSKCVRGVGTLHDLDRNAHDTCRLVALTAVRMGDGRSVQTSTNNFPSPTTTNLRAR